MAILALASFALLGLGPSQPQVPAEPVTPSYEKRGEVKLKQVRAFYLRTPGERGKPTGPLYSTSFGGDLDKGGRFITAYPDNVHESWDVVLIDASGAARTIPTGISSEGMNMNQVLFTGEHSALLVGEFYLHDRKAAFWSIDFTTGKTQRIWQDIRRETVSQILQLTGGNFLVHSYLGIDIITPDGKVIWEEKLSNESPFLPPYRLAVSIAGVGELPGNRIAVGQVSSNRVTIFDETGKELETIKLEDSSMAKRCSQLRQFCLRS